VCVSGSDAPRIPFDAVLGNAPIDIMRTEGSVHAIRSSVRTAAELVIRPGENVIPIIVGVNDS
jgi:hypothetical protein